MLDPGSIESPWVLVYSHNLKEEGLVFSVSYFRGEIIEVFKNFALNVYRGTKNSGGVSNFRNICI